MSTQTGMMIFLLSAETTSDSPVQIGVLDAGDLVVGSVTLIVALISWFAYRYRRRHGRAEYNHALEEAWNAYHLALSRSEKLMEANEKRKGLPTVVSARQNRIRNLNFYNLNVWHSAFLGYQDKLIAKHYLDEIKKDSRHIFPTFILTGSRILPTTLTSKPIAAFYTKGVATCWQK